MHLNAKQQFRMETKASALLDGSWLVRAENKRKWLSIATVNAIGCELGNHFNAADPAGDGRKSMIKAVKARVTKMNQDYGFIILPIILFAIISWLIQRLLDHLFLNELNID